LLFGGENGIMATKPELKEGETAEQVEAERAKEQELIDGESLALIGS